MSLQQLLNDESLGLGGPVRSPAAATQPVGLPINRSGVTGVAERSIFNKFVQSGMERTDVDLNRILSSLWDKQIAADETTPSTSTPQPSQTPQPPQTPTQGQPPTPSPQSSQPQQGVKRKASDMVADSTDNVDTEPSTSTQVNNIVTSSSVGGPQLGVNVMGFAPGSKLSQRNVLLAQLLNQKPSKQENVVNTQHTVAPATQTPQARLPKDLSTKLLESNNNNPGTQNKHDEIPPTNGAVTNLKDAPDKRPTAWDNPRTTPNRTYPGNTNDKPGVAGAQGGTANTPGGAQQGPQAAISSVTSSTDAVTSDPDLNHILQEATELQNDFSSGQFNFDQTMSDDNLSSVLDSVSGCLIYFI